MIKAIPTTVDGINFRSKLEAHWYLVFKSFLVNPIYEPEAFKLSTTCGELAYHTNYLPDFHVKCRFERSSYYVEVKPSLDGQARDIAKACILGYEHPTIVIIGSPFQYRALCVNERHKGSPRGFFLCFGQGGFVCKRNEFYLYSSYPDENRLQVDERELRTLLTYPVNSIRGAQNYWNSLQFQHRGGK